MISVVTIYEKPADYPDSFVARRHTVGAAGTFATNDYQIAPTIEPLRAWAKEQCLKYNQSAGTNMGRSESDRPEVIENWL